MKSNLAKVFFDANVIIRTGKPPGGPVFARLIDLVDAGFIQVLTTDLTKEEVAKKHVENDYDVIKEIGRPHFRKIANEALGVEFPEVNKTDIKKALEEKYRAATENMFSSIEATTLPIDSIPPSNIFADYAAGKGMFSSKGKKDQFPDAFIFACLKAQASDEAPITIVSGDNDFVEATENEEFISLVKSIPDLFKGLGLEIDAPNMGAFLEAKLDDILSLADSELSGWGLQAVDVNDAYIEESSITEIELIESTSFGSAEEGGEILVIGKMIITANVAFSHPNWDTAMYDSEDKVLIPFEDVSGEKDVKFDADYSISILVDKDGSPIQIHEFQFRNEMNFYVDLYAYDPYEM